MGQKIEFKRKKDVTADVIYIGIEMNRVATVREKVLENETFFQVREKSGHYIFSQGNLKKKKKVMEKSKFQNFPKKMLVNKLLEILVAIICKQY